MKISDETKVGILAAFGITIMILGYSFLRGNDLFVTKKSYFVVFQKVDGLNVSDPVMVNGFFVGKVAAMTLQSGAKAKIVCRLTIEEGIQLTKNTSAKLISSDLLGEKAVQLKIGNAKEIAQNGDTLIGSVQASLQEEVSAQMLPVKQKAEDLLGSIDSVINVVKTILAGGQIENSIASIGTATNKFAQLATTIDSFVVSERQKLSHILSNIENLTSNLNANDTNITNILTNVSTLTDSLSKTNFAELGANLSTSLEELSILLNNINNSDGTIGRLINEDQVYENLNDAVENLESLLADVEENPARYIRFSVFGRSGDKNRKSSKKDSEEEPETDTEEQ